MSRGGRVWTTREVAFLERNAAHMAIQAVSQALGRTEAGVERKIKELRIQRQPRERVLDRPYREPTEAELHHMNRLHLGDLKRAGHALWHGFAAAEADTLPVRIPVPDSTFSLSSCVGSPAAMCSE